MTLKTIFKHVSKVKFIIMFLLMCVAGFDGVIMSQVISRVSQFNQSFTLSDVIYLIVFSLLAYVVVQCANMLATFLVKNLTKTLNQYYKTRLIKAIYAMSKKQDVSETISVMTVDFKLIEDQYFAILFRCLFYGLMGLISLIYLVYLNPFIAILFIACSFLPMLPAFLFEKMLSKSTETFTQSNSNFIKSIKDLFQGYDEISTYHAFPTFFKRTREVLFELEKNNEQLGCKHAVVEFTASSLSWLSYLLPISVALFLVVQGQLDASAVIALFLASDRVIYPFKAVSNYLRLIKSTKTTREKIMTIIESNQTDDSNAVALSLQQPALAFENVSFAYTNVLFEGVNLNIPYGSKVLITGPSGSGKSTLLDLIQSKVQPTTGSITLFDRNQQLPLNSFEMARIQQEPYYFELTLRENLVMNLKDVTDERLIDLLKTLNLWQELGEDCLDKYYGEQGDLLSGGQKQRIEVIRAIIHQKKFILVDEATSSVDNLSSQKIRELLFKQNATLLEVAHHFDANLDDYYTHHLMLKDQKIILEDINYKKNTQ